MRLVRFAIVGSCVASIYVLIYVGLLTLDVSQPLANAIAFLIAIVSQYIGQAKFTFGKDINDRRQMLRFVSMAALGYITAAVITGSVMPTIGVSDWAAAVVVTIILPIQNYIIMKAWVFSRVPKAKEVAP